MKLTTLARLGGSADANFRTFSRRADVARDEGRFRDAAALYTEALRLAPSRGGLHVQAGHMFKEVGDLVRAEQHYLQALRLMPGDADLQLQLGHFYKAAGRIREAERAYARSAEMKPEGTDAPAELERLRRSGWRGPVAAADARLLAVEVDAHEAGTDPRTADLHVAHLYGRMAPENLPRRPRDMITWSHESVNVRQFGVRGNTFWGLRHIARGVEAIRGFCISFVPLDGVEARVNGLSVARDQLLGPFDLEYEADPTRAHKYSFNIWYDFSRFTPGRYELELRFREPGDTVRSHSLEFVVEPPLLEADHPDSDGVVNLDPADPRPVDEQVNARPAVLHEAVRPDLLGEVNAILVMRADQLGDLVASIPGILRLRELFPAARLVGLFGPANVDLARTLGVFDELLVANHREDMYFRTRILTLAEQEELRDRLAPFRFDLAIDLSQSLMSRPVLALSGARFLYGFNDPHWPRLSASADDALYDPKNRRETAAHSVRIVTLVERLGALRHGRAEVIRRADLPRERVARFGIGADDRYAAIHTGARIVFSRWAHYLPLAERLLADTDLKVVLFAGNGETRDTLPPPLRDTDRFILVEGQLPFDDFDALLSHAAVYAGNDTGPKHLASLRGVPVVSIHSARINWSEWGQEHTGVVVSRKVPCAGCSIYHDVDECGKNFVCMKAITLDDVYGAVRRYV